MGVTEQRLASFIAEFPTKRIPPEILHLGKRLLLNNIGVALYAANDPAINYLLSVFEEEGGKKRASVIGTGYRTTLLNAALANGFLGHFEDYDDTHLATVIHTASPIFPAAMASAEMLGASGLEMLTAGVLGIEVACRIGLLIVPHFIGTGHQWHITNTCGVFGAAAASARLLGLTQEQIEHALSLAGTQAMGIREVFGSMAKPFHAGKAASNGLIAAMLTKRDFTAISAGSPGILSGPRAFAATFAKGYDLATVTAGLGETWELPNVAIKPHACGQANHALLDSITTLKTKPGVTLEAIESIHGSVRHTAPNIVDRRHPKKGLEGKFSYHHTMTSILMYGNCYPQQFTDAKVNDPRAIAMRDRITVVADESVPKHAAKVVMTLKSGQVYTVLTPHSLGSPENPLSDQQLEDKFRAIAEDVMPKAKVDRLLKALWSLEKVRHMGELAELFVQPVNLHAKKAAKKAAKKPAKKTAKKPAKAGKPAKAKKSATAKKAPKARKPAKKVTKRKAARK